MDSAEKELSILIVEDEKIARMVLSALLKKQYSNVVTAENGKDGLALYSDISPDIVITDLEMPVMSGMEMIRLIREQNSDIPILVTTAYSDKEHAVSDVQRILVKPIVRDELFSIIDTLT